MGVQSQPAAHSAYTISPVSPPIGLITVTEDIVAPHAQHALAFKVRFRRVRLGGIPWGRLFMSGILVFVLGFFLEGCFSLRGPFARLYRWTCRKLL